MSAWRNAWRQASEAGFTGMETGQRFPMNMGGAGTHTGSLRHLGSAEAGFPAFCWTAISRWTRTGSRPRWLEFFIAARTLPASIYGETARSIQGNAVSGTPGDKANDRSEAEMAVYGRQASPTSPTGAQRQGMPILPSTIIWRPWSRPRRNSICMMKHSSVPLLFDAGHMAFAGGDNMRVIENHHARMTHVHTKDVRHAGHRRSRPREARAFSMP